MHRQPGTDVVGQLVEVAPVGFGQDEFADADAARGDDLFADAADRQDLAGEREFAGHGERTRDFFVLGQ